MYKYLLNKATNIQRGDEEGRNRDSFSTKYEKRVFNESLGKRNKNLFNVYRLRTDGERGTFELVSTFVLLFFKAKRCEKYI